MKKTLLLVITLISIVSLAFVAPEEALLKTSLRITVINELGNTEEGVVLKLYPTEDDYKEETNMIGDSIVTDKKGRATFKDLEPIIYFVSAEKGTKNNHGAGIQTNPLEEGKMNKVNIVIE